MSDGGAPSLTTTVVVAVYVTDVNEATPVFTGQPASTNLIESTAIGR